MDYPKSVPSVGLVNGQFVDEDPIAGKPGSLIPATWGNSVTQEILNVVQAAGLTPNESSNNQLLGALRSPALFMTAPQFDGGRSAATSEFVQRALGSYASARGISTATQLTLADVGCSIGLGGNAAYTVTLPDAAAVPSGGTISLHCRNSAPVTVASKTGAQISPQGAYLASIVLNNGESANFVRESGVWVVYGTAALKYSASYAVQFGTSGYQKFPSGLILQWVTGGSDANGNMTVSLPIRFPNAVLGGVANEGNPAGWSASNVTVWAFDGGSSTTTTVVARVRSVLASSVKADPGISGRILVWGY
ncbi:phage tail protein [Pseudomonas sp. MYb2]|uniref:gp53-like domain-containing protein n=1 Tax=unclassified Pseudomonas TaxID=196821 RepID=UPI000CFF0E3C|nr:MULTISPECIES: phage tail protein [unclassified Pseudomonas]PRB55369.1 phage tail protein [Pseudomonas sp. MYb3]PRC33278.1 phage tail protein [Pseudomonas sp. MYb2]